jgi:P-type conjugative transfer protein TrbG
MTPKGRRWLAIAAVLLGTSGLCAGAAMAQALTADEAKALGISRQWEAGRGLVTRGSDGKIIYLYGEVEPSVICSPLQVCDIELQAGETVEDVLVGDTVRWKVEPAMSGSADGQTVHLIVKPSEPDLETSMVVTTSRRTYHIELKSDDNQFMPRIGFDYPEDVNASLAALGQQIQASVVPGAGVPADELDFKFSADGNAPWRPTRIYSDGVKTYIQFPSALTGQDAPVLFVIDGGQNRIVNYRMEGTMMVVDYRIDQAILISGVGRTQHKITIKREG